MKNKNEIIYQFCTRNNIYEMESENYKKLCELYPYEYDGGIIEGTFDMRGDWINYVIENSKKIDRGTHVLLKCE